MRAATALHSLFKSDGAAPAVPALPPRLWRADDLPGADVAGLSTGFAALDAELPGGGWPLGQLTELQVDAPGIGELSLLAPALAALGRDPRRSRSCVWVLPVGRPAPGAEPALPYAPALQAAGIDLARCMFVQPATPREAWWSLEQSLRTGQVGAVIGWLPAATGADADFRALRRLQLLAAQPQALVIVLRSAGQLPAASPAALRLRLAQADGRLQVTLLKRRGRPLLEPLALQMHPDDWRHARIAPPATAEPVELPAGLAARATARLDRWSLRALFSH